MPEDCVDPLMSLIKKRKSQAVMYCLEDLTVLRGPDRKAGLDCGLDSGLDFGPDSGLDFGLTFIDLK